MTAITPAVREVAGLIADQITQYGHYQDGKTTIAWSEPPSQRSCCIVAGHPYESMPGGGMLVDGLCEAIVEVAGIAAVIDVDGENVVEMGKRDAVVEWNDAVKTDDVLNVLRAIEVG